MPDSLRQRPLTVVVLAAGEGTRMKSRRPKVLHGFAGRSMLGHVLASVAVPGVARTLVVIGHGREQVRTHLTEIAPDATAVVQEPQGGTGHAVRIALDTVPADPDGDVLVVPGDAPLLRRETVAALVDRHASGADVTVLTSVVEDPAGYGRVIRDGAGRVARIVEDRDASGSERAVAEINTSVYVFREAPLRDALTRLSTDNQQREEYLTDVVEILAADARVEALLAAAAETAGVNDRVQLAAAHRTLNTRLLEAHMRAGVTVVDPLTTWVDVGVRIEPDAVLMPSTQLCGTTAIGAEAVVGPQTTLVDTSVGARAQLDRCVAKQARIGADVTVGPYAYLRPGTELADGVHVGTYVELKNAQVGEGTKVPHLTYVGDATIGEHSNIGAATVFVNYDGVAKHHSVIGSHVRTGADNMFVAPVEVGDGAYTAAGSVITENVPPGALAVARATQRNVAGWVAKKRPGTPAADAAARALSREEDRKDEV